MTYKLFIAYDLDRPGQDYRAVQSAIKQLGPWMHLQGSLFYVETWLNTQQAHDRISSVMDANDKLAVMHAPDNVVSGHNPLPMKTANALADIANLLGHPPVINAFAGLSSLPMKGALD